MLLVITHILTSSHCFSSKNSTCCPLNSNMHTCKILGISSVLPREGPAGPCLGVLQPTAVILQILGIHGQGTVRSLWILSQYLGLAFGYSFQLLFTTDQKLWFVYMAINIFGKLLFLHTWATQLKIVTNVCLQFSSGEGIPQWGYGFLYYKTLKRKYKLTVKYI